uniref:Uncharacterized protein n=1 Tax=Anguilla anguilla TaxID=7936 RepID=A0A0E9W4B3_ANGAN
MPDFPVITRGGELKQYFYSMGLGVRGNYFLVGLECFSCA